MLYEFHKEIAALLARKGQPAAVRFGPERVSRAKFPGQVIVIEHDESGDQLAAPQGISRNPRKVFDRMIGAQATIYARSSLPNAHRGDHERECEKIVDAFTVALYSWAVTVVKSPKSAPISGMRYIKPKDVDGSEITPEVWPGVVYEIKFRVARGVYDRTYTAEQNPGAARPVGAATAVQNRTDATAPGYDPATGCGAA
jgi:hypothetical protein